MLIRDVLIVDVVVVAAVVVIRWSLKLIDTILERIYTRLRPRGRKKKHTARVMDTHIIENREKNHPTKNETREESLSLLKGERSTY